MSGQSNLEALMELRSDLSRQEAMLENVRDDVKEIKDSLVGSGDSPGLRIEIDRLKRSHAILNAITWFAFTTTVGAILTFFVSHYLTGN